MKRDHKGNPNKSADHVRLYGFMLQSDAWTVAAGWLEYMAAEAIEDARYAFDGNYTPHRWVEARAYVLEGMLDTHPAHSLSDLRARMSWFEYLSRREVQWTHKSDLLRFATLRADIERMGVRLREQDAAGVQSGHSHRLTRTDRHAAIREFLSQGLSDREVARRLGISPTTVGAVRRQV